MNTTPWTTPWLVFSPEAEEKKTLRKDANFIGFILIALLAAQVLIGIVLGVGNAMGLLELTQDDYGLGHIGRMLFRMLEYILYVGLPVIVVALILRRRANPFPTCRTPRGTYTVAIFGGMAMAFLANMAANFAMSFFTELGVPYPEMPDNFEPTVMSLVLNLISTALLPALLEEMTMRGYVLGALRPYGDRMAVILSAVLFGLIHGNVLQLPFAFILGFVLGWLTVQTESIWPAVTLHFINNALSITLSWAEQFTGDDQAPSVIAFLVFCVVGTLTFLAAFLQKKRYRTDLLRPLGNAPTALLLSQRVKTILTAPAFLTGGILWIGILIFSMVPKG